MPTSTATLTTTRMAKSPVSLKPMSSSKSTLATLRSLYPRAARAFLQRNVLLTHSLLLSAFSNLEPPHAVLSSDPLASHRRKWDMLRITLETTLYTSASAPADDLPDALRSLLVLAPPSLLATMHTRSLQLFTPANRGKPSSEFLPSQILVALALASIKLDCVHVGREMIEDWLTRRGQTQHDTGRTEKQAQDVAEGYEKVLEMYCLHVLPRLEDWDYARDFVRYEDELPEDRKAYLVQSLQILHAQYLEDLDRIRERQRQSLLSPQSSSRTPTPKPPAIDRTPSPSPSSTSTSSNSTHTVVPHTQRPHPIPPSITSLTPAPTPRAQSPRPSHATALAQRHSRSATPLPLPSPPSAPQMPVASIPPPSLLALLKSSILPHLTTPNLTFFILMFLVPLISFVFRLRRRRLRIGPKGGSAISAVKYRGNAGDEARRRLRAGWWAEVRRAVADTVKMAGSGFV